MDYQRSKNQRKKEENINYKDDERTNNHEAFFNLYFYIMFLFYIIMFSFITANLLCVMNTPLVSAVMTTPKTSEMSAPSVSDDDYFERVLQMPFSVKPKPSVAAPSVPPPSVSDDDYFERVLQMSDDEYYELLQIPSGGKPKTIPQKAAAPKVLMPNYIPL